MIGFTALLCLLSGASPIMIDSGPDIEHVGSIACPGVPHSVRFFDGGRVVGISLGEGSDSGELYLVDHQSGAKLDRKASAPKAVTAPAKAEHPIERELSFALNRVEGSVTLTDRLNGGVLAVVDVGQNPTSALFSPDFTGILVLSNGDDTLSWINTASYQVTSRIAEGIGPGAWAIANCPGGKYALISNSESNTISVFDYAERKVVDQVVVDDGPTEIVIHPDGKQAYVVCGPLRSVCVLSLPSTDRPKPEKFVPNKVFVLGTIHDGHETSKIYDLEFLKAFIREVKPDYILAEIPPNRARAAMQGFLQGGEVSEERVSRFPEYLHVVYPLTRELDFEIIPTAGWTEPMARFRRTRLQAISADPDRAAEWAEYQAASRAAEECQAKLGADDDPYLIHSDAYDDCVQLDLAVYDRLFNDELGPGGWTAINRSHYGNIERALDEHSGEGRRFLVTYGAGHKGWFLRELRKRKDIELVDLAPFFKRAEHDLGRD